MLITEGTGGGTGTIIEEPFIMLIKLLIFQLRYTVYPILIVMAPPRTSRARRVSLDLRWSAKGCFCLVGCTSLTDDTGFSAEPGRTAFRGFVNLSSCKSSATVPSSTKESRIRDAPVSIFCVTNVDRSDKICPSDAWRKR